MIGFGAPTVGAAGLLQSTQSSAQSAPATGSASFFFTGSPQTFMVPPAVYALTVSARGGSGGLGGFGIDFGGDYLGFGGDPGYGATVNATVFVNPGDTLSVWIGGRGGFIYSGGPGAPAGGSSGWSAPTAAGGSGGSGDGDAGSGGGGGGATGLVDTTTGQILVVAGGGAGGGGGGGLQVPSTAGGTGGSSAYLSNAGSAGSGSGAGAAGSGLSADPLAANGSAGAALTEAGGGGGGGGGAPQDGPGGGGGALGAGGGGGGAGGASEVGLGSAATFGTSIFYDPGYLTVGWASPSATVVLSSSANPVVAGQPVTFTVNLFAGPRSNDPVPTGTVAFADNGQPLGTQPVNSSGLAIMTVSTLPAGSNQITATYSGDSVYTQTTSNPLSQVVQPALALQLSTSTLSFAPQLLKQPSAPQAVTVNNIGADPVTFNSVMLAKGGFRLSANTCRGQLAPGATCTFSVQSRPTVPGPAQATVTLNDNAVASPQTVALTGWGITPTTPSVTGLNPPAGYTSGGTVVTITGTDFSGATAVSFGGVPATAVTCGATSCTATSPVAASSGPVDVQVISPAGTSPPTAADKFLYTIHF